MPERSAGPFLSPADSIQWLCYSLVLLPGYSNSRPGDIADTLRCFLCDVWSALFFPRSALLATSQILAWRSLPEHRGYLRTCDYTARPKAATDSIHQSTRSGYPKCRLAE